MAIGKRHPWADDTMHVTPSGWRCGTGRCSWPCRHTRKRKVVACRNGSTLPPGQPLLLESLISPTAQGIASRVLAKAAGGSTTLFAFDAGQGLTEHTSPFDALVQWRW